MMKISKEKARCLVLRVSGVISEGGELPVEDLTKIFDYVLQDNPLMLTVRDVKSEYSVGTTTIYEWFKRGLKKTNCGGTRIRREDLESFIAEGKA